MKLLPPFFSVEGSVDFTPLEGRSYVVTGELKKAASCAWIADEQSLAPVTEKVCEKYRREAPASNASSTTDRAHAAPGEVLTA